ncbi:ABC transporter ATP-binding protein [[Acholeplasma] multilocale]|uniref:ABC transporter ATP-binding protein n=1 Tax=[Acholeplasma] multilocale TaxID=264638 RepID=UPI0005508A37|nr:ABC transporter ATP-binding protein [[Acholeplasma] multilocale]
MEKQVKNNSLFGRKNNKRNSPEERKINKALFATIIKYYRIEWKLTITMLCLIMITVMCSIMLPLLTQQMNMSVAIKAAINAEGIENISPDKWATMHSDFWGLHWDKLIYIALGVIVLYCVVSFCFDYLSYMMGRRIEISLRNLSLEALVRQDISYYSDKKIGEILTKVISDTQIVGDASVMVPLQLVVSVFEIIASFVMMLVLAWQLALVVLFIFAIIMLIMISCYAATKLRFTKVRRVITEINGNVTDRIATVRLIKATGTENYETARFKEVHKDYYKKSKSVAKMESLMLTSMWGGVFIIQFAGIIGAMVLYGETNPAFFTTTFVAFTLASSIMIGPIFQVMAISFTLAQASVAATRVDQAINSKSILDPHYWDGEQVPTIRGDIKFEGVSFAYPEKPTKTIIPEFDFIFKEGKSYAFVGETGSGKSTIARLLLRFYDPTSGEVIINGNQNLKDVHLASYLEHVGYVEQDPQILYGDVFENVRYGKFGASDHEVYEACKKAELHELVMTWPDGYDTILGERGFMLSGGQKQRLVIARMFLKNPTLLILDEATSALDNIVEKEIQVKLEALMEGRTSVSIAHRLSTIKNCDEIIVLGANGAGVVQAGTFDELKNKPGHFKKLYEAGLMD